MKNNTFTVELDPNNNRIEVVSGIALSHLGELEQSYVRIGDGEYVPPSAVKEKGKGRRGKQIEALPSPTPSDKVELIPVVHAPGTVLTFCTPIVMDGRLALTTRESGIQPEHRAIVRLRIPGGSLGGGTEWHVRTQSESKPVADLGYAQHQWQEQKKIPAGGVKKVVELATGDVVSVRDPFTEYLFALPAGMILVITRSGNVSPNIYRTIMVRWDRKALEVKFMARVLTSSRRSELKREPQTVS